MGIDYYGILQVKRCSTDLEIKQAYRKLALEFNPTRLQNNSTKKIFALIAEAYDVLGNPLRRAVFDQYGEEGLKSGIPGPEGYIKPYHFHGDPMRTYKDFFGTNSPYADLLDYLASPPPLYTIPSGRGIKKKQPPIYHPLVLTLHEIYFGGVKKMKIHRLVFISEDSSKTEVKEKILTIPIKPGMRSGVEIVFPEEGDQNPTHIPADVIFVTEERPHDCFTRDNDDLIMYVNISLEQALLGTTVVIDTIDHRTIRVPITDIVGTNYEKVVENEGLPILEQPSQKGNLRIRFSVEFPPYLPKASKKVLQNGFQLAKLGAGLGQHEMINKVILADKILRVDPEEQKPPGFKTTNMFNKS